MSSRTKMLSWVSDALTEYCRFGNKKGREAALQYCEELLHDRISAETAKTRWISFFKDPEMVGLSDDLCKRLEQIDFSIN